ncbi:hypothetical protein DPM19_34445 [Actinomadura craniellae]|uniref:Plasmid mobilization relaxosome protein MobC n=1 Tax=Actinomadura craniellae TaxID=2231787 RepID=A0A365GV35_9ACTN|nr:hypothetical protein [Actinomadura craniellae]RAY10657.1 hypothetical protein DPM19_34445 [Actinomadura craniellae]
MQLWLSDEELAEVAGRAREARMAVGAFAAECLLAALREAPPPGSLVPHDVLVALNRAVEQVRRIGNNYNQAVTKLHVTGQRTDDLLPYGREMARTFRRLEELAESVSAHIHGARR